MWFLDETRKKITNLSVFVLKRFKGNGATVVCGLNKVILVRTLRLAFLAVLNIRHVSRQSCLFLRREMPTYHRAHRTSVFLWV